MWDGTITWELVLAFFALSSAIGGVWWKVAGMVAAAKADSLKIADAAHVAAATVRQDFALYQRHVAETYVTKAGLHEQTAQIMNAIHDVGASVDRLNERVDRVIEVRNKA